MDVREATKEEKEICIAKIKKHFDYMKSVMETLQTDCDSEDMMTQAKAVWIAGSLCEGFNEFMQQLHNGYLARKEMEEFENEQKDNENEPKIN